MDENTGYTVYNSTDPMEMWECSARSRRLIGPGDFSKPTMFSEMDGPARGPEIFEQMLTTP